MTEELTLVYEKFNTYFIERRFADLRILLLDTEPADIAYYIENELIDTDQIKFFRLLPKELASDVFIEIDNDIQENLIKSFTDKELKAVVDDLFLDDAVDIIEEMPANVVKRILVQADPENRKQINELLKYPDDSAGSLMTTEFVSFSKDLLVGEAIEKIRKTGVNKETIYTCYVTDNKKHLIGVLTVKDLLLSNNDDVIENIMDTNVITVLTNEDKEEVASILSKYDFLALPVIDNEGCIVGIITVDDAVDVIHEEATEDIQKMAAILPSEKPYLKQSVFKICWARAPWLIFLLITSTFTSLILSGYESKLSTVLYAFVPMLMGTAGNAGGQASVTIIRAIAVDDIRLKDVFKVLLKEVCVALLLGIVIGAICFAKIMLLDRLFAPVSLTEAVVISVVCAVSILLAKIIGCALPLIAKAVRLDPAVVASPLMTTIVDALSLIIYCAIAFAIL